MRDLKKKLVPTHKYKTQVIFFDDDKNFLNFLAQNLFSTKYHFSFVNNYSEFNQKMLENESIIKGLPSILVELDHELADLTQHTTFDFDLTKFEEIKNFSNKDKEVSLSFIDNALENLNGIEVSANLNIGMQKILLTGACELEEAIEALSDTVIHNFIEKIELSTGVNKSEQDLIAKIIKAIDTFTDRYFINKNYYNNKLLSNQVFKDLFDKIINQHDIIEYYLQEKDKFILINQVGTEKILKCWDEKDFENYYLDYYDEFDSNNNKILQQIKDNFLIPINSKLVNPIRYENLYYSID